MKAEIIFKDGYTVEVNTGVGPQGPRGVQGPIGPQGEKGERGNDAAINGLAIPENDGKVVAINDHSFVATDIMALISEISKSGTIIYDGGSAEM